MAVDSLDDRAVSPHPVEESESELPVVRHFALFRGGQVAVVTLFGLSVWRLAWMSDDALITMRTALNAAHGMGLVYNQGERVEAYTHPLWFFIMWAAGAITGSWIYSLLAISILLATAAAAILVFQVRDWARLSLVGVALLMSNSLLVWSTSGLEGPLAMLLLALFFVAYREESPPKRLGVLGLIAAAMILTRMDYALLLIPALAWITWVNRRDAKRLAALVCAIALPLLLWFGFSVYYYAALLPTTFTAKTNTKIPKAELIAQGSTYLAVSSVYDVVIPIVMITALVIAAVVGGARSIALMVGVIFYLLYVVWVGGDFMVARFLAVPLFACLLITADPRTRTMPHDRSDWAARLIPPGLVTVAVLTVALAAGNTLFRQNSPPTSSTGDHGIADERAFWVSRGGALDPLHQTPTLSGTQTSLDSLEVDAERWSNQRPNPRQEIYVLCGGLGTAGITLGPATHLIDTCGLSDRFVAMLPFIPNGPWRIGHFERQLPDGYVDAVRWSNPDLVIDPSLRAKLVLLWEKIRSPLETP